MKFLIVGLGNPGEKYENTRHNIGFKILDFLSDEFKVDFKEERYGYITMFKFKARQYFLLKPSTYMNLSGKAVNFWLQKLSLDQKKLLVINDDISLPYGLLRIKGKGGDAGHNGLKSIEEKIGNKSYARLKFGVGKDFLKGSQSKYVLSQWNKVEQITLNEHIKKAANVILDFASIGLSETMNRHNNL